MEVFRTDGSGKDYANKRLFDLISNIQKKFNSDIFVKIDTVIDSKGRLEIYFNNEFKEIDKFIYYVVFLWENESESYLDFYLKNSIYKSFPLC